MTDQESNPDFPVLLVDPRAPSYGLNIALATLGASLRQADISVRVLDQNNRRDVDPLEDLRAAIAEFQPAMIGFTVLYITQHVVTELIRQIRREFTGPIVVGGPQIKLLKSQVLDDIPGVDFAFMGEAEEGLVTLCRAIAAGTAPSEVPGLVYRRDADVVCVPEGKTNRKLDALPFPDYSLYGISKIRQYPLLTSRGCPYACTYCFRTHRHDWRCRSPEDIMLELHQAREKYGIEEVVVLDDSFNIRPARVIEFCRLWQEQVPDLPWNAVGVRADRITAEMAEAMSAAGCHTVAVGVESLVPEVFASLNKREETEDIVRGIRLLQAAGINVRGYFIIGLPGDTYERTMETFRQARQLNLTNQGWTLLMPIPGTEMYQQIYQRPDVRRLNSYLDVEMIWMPDKPEVLPTFDVPEFTAAEKLRAYYTINTKLGLSFVKHPHRPVLRVLEALGLIFRYAPLSSPILVARLIKKYLGRLYSGRPLISTLTSGIEYDC